MPGRVVPQARVRLAALAPALVEEDDPVRLGVEEAPVVFACAAARSPVHEHRWLAVGIAALLVVDLVVVVHGEETVVVRFDVGVEGTEFFAWRAQTQRVGDRHGGSIGVPLVPRIRR